MVVQTDFVSIAHRIVWCTVASVDRRNRPRSRILHPIWELGGERLVAWITTRPTALKRAHLAHSPFLSCSYWSPTHDTAVADCRAVWERQEAIIEHVWRLFRAAPAPLGHDPADIWPDGPASHDAALLRLDPWRLRVARGEEIAAGRPPRSWRAPAAWSEDAGR